MKSTKPSTNPFVYVIAAALIAALSFGIRYMISALEANEAVTAQETEVKDYLAPRDLTKKKDDAMMKDESTTGTMST
jgi:hypothetical protein